LRVLPIAFYLGNNTAVEMKKLYKEDNFEERIKG